MTTVAIPLFVLPGALNARAEAIGRHVVSALSRGTPCPVYAIDGPGYVDLREAMLDAMLASMFVEIDGSAPHSSALAPAAAAHGQLVRCRDAAELLSLAAALPGQTDIGLQMADGDAPLAVALGQALAGRSGQILINTPFPSRPSNRSTP